VTSREHPFTVAIFAVATVLASAAASSQSELDAAASRQRQLVDSIEREVSRGGAYSEELIAPLSELALLYQEADDRALASATIEKALQVVRTNYGLYSLAQAPLISRLVANEAAAGNHEMAWEVEDELLTLAKRHPEDLRTVAIFREIGDRRVRLSSHELPLSVVCRGHLNAAGCHEENEFDEGRNEFSVGSVRSLVNAGAMNNWGDAINVFLQNRLYDSQELRELEQKLIALGGCDVARESYRRLMLYDEASAGIWLNRGATIVRAADSELVCSQNQPPALKRAALERYREAYELLERNAVDRASIDELFAPELPIRLTDSLPARAYNLRTAAPSDSIGHIDIAFEITKYGRARRIDIVDATPNCTDEEKKNLVRFVRDGLYRPRAANGAIVDGSRVVWRYYR
jgi:tetratricopeptide (TPR) repeat protein